MEMVMYYLGNNDKKQNYLCLIQTQPQRAHLYSVKRRLKINNSQTSAGDALGPVEWQRTTHLHAHGFRILLPVWKTQASPSGNVGIFLP